MRGGGGHLVHTVYCFLGGDFHSYVPPPHIVFVVIFTLTHSHAPKKWIKVDWAAIDRTELCSIVCNSFVL